MLSLHQSEVSTRKADTDAAYPASRWGFFVSFSLQGGGNSFAGINRKAYDHYHSKPGRCLFAGVTYCF